MPIDGFNSEWAPVTTGVSQGSALGPVLFIFADDTKIGKSVLTDEDRQSLQEDLHKTSAWSDRWEVPFNVDKCHVLQVGTRNKKFDYEMRDFKLKSVQRVKELGVKIVSNFKFSQQCIDAANNANRKLGFFNRNFFY